MAGKQNLSVNYVLVKENLRLKAKKQKMSKPKLPFESRLRTMEANPTGFKYSYVWLLYVSNDKWFLHLQIQDRCMKCTGVSLSS